MKKYVVKRKTAGLCAVICAGMLLSAGCAGSDANTQAKTGTTEVSSNLENESVTYLSIEADQEEVTKETEMVSPDAAAEGTDADQGEKAAETLDTFTDASDMIESADVSGTAGGCSDAGFMMNTSPFADGSSSSGDGGSIKIVYADGAVFQKGLVKSDGSSYSLKDSEKSGLKDKDFVLCFGNQQEDGTFLADRIIVIEFN